MSPPGIHGHDPNKTHLCSDGVTPSGEEFRDTCRIEASLCQAECCPQTGAASSPGRAHGSVRGATRRASDSRADSHDDGVVLVLDERVLAERLGARGVCQRAHTGRREESAPHGRGLHGGGVSTGRVGDEAR